MQVAVVSLALFGSCVDDIPEESSDSDPVVVASGGVPRQSVWRYWDRGGDLGTAWRGSTFDDAAWSSHSAPLGYGESYVDPISYGPSSTNKYITSYFRTQFTLDDVGSIVSMTGELMYDDGLVVYLNGHEIQRVAMPTGTVTASTLASGHEANDVYERFDWSASRTFLVQGVNTLAVEVHQAAASSSDLVFDLSLSVARSSAGGIGRGATWSYWDRGTDLGTVWRSSSFDDSTWASGAGPLGYGETYLASTVGYGSDASNKYITTYFRHRFTVADPSAVRTMIGELMFDDGAVVYLNGTQIASVSMPVGTPNASTLALGHEANDAYATFDWSASKSLLVAGTNTIEVEVHQAAATSSDLVFDLSLRLDAGPPPPPPPTLDYRIARRSTWSYWDRGGDLGTAWRSPTFDDASWARGGGPLGYGETYLTTPISYGTDPANKPITTYFRAKFLVDSQPYFLYAIRGELMYDDGFVVYLNGHEIARAAMPTGTITASTRALDHEANNTYESWDWTSAGQYLVSGENTIAVEVHQTGPASSDVVFDLGLDVSIIPQFDRVTTEPVLSGGPVPSGEPPYAYDRKSPSVLKLPDGSWVMYVTDETPGAVQIYRATSPDGVAWTTGTNPVWQGDDPCVLFDGSLYRMWYTIQGFNDDDAIGLATSSDGVHWTSGASGPVLASGGGTWEMDAFDPAVIKDGSIYKMWFQGKAQDGSHYETGYATSSDGITWTKRPNAVILDPTFGFTVMYDRGEYKGWYSPTDNPRSIEYATSRDGISWTRWLQVPTLSGSGSGSWDELVSSGSVVRDGDVLRMWYVGEDATSFAQIGYATHP